MKKCPSIGLALGSGGARGFAHITLLETLHEMGMNVSFLSGSSMGAVVAAAYALHPDPRVLKRMTRHFLDVFRDRIHELINNVQANVALRKRIVFLTRLVNSISLDHSDFLYSSLSRIFGKARFSDCKIPCVVVAASLKGELVTLDEGYIVDAVAASASVPGAFPPIRLGGEWLVDGGVISVIPVSAVKKLGADVVIASHVGYASFKRGFTDVLDYAIHLDDIKGEILANEEMKEADVVACFRNIKVPWYRFDLAENIMENARRVLEEQNFHNKLINAMQTRPSEKAVKT